MAGYSSTPLHQKLGLKAGMIAQVMNAPENYFDLVVAAGVVFDSAKNHSKEFIHFFTTSAAELNDVLPVLRNQIVSNGMIWISWPKKSSKVKTDIQEDLIRILALQNDLVDVKVCAVDEVWSALKLVIPLKSRR